GSAPLPCRVLRTHVSTIFAHDASPPWGGESPHGTARPIRPDNAVLIRPPRAGSVPSDRGRIRRAQRGQLDAAARRARLRVPGEEPYMSIKSKVLAAAATLTLVGGLSAAGALT